MVKVYNKIHKYTNVISYFSTQNWTFQVDNMHRLCDRMSPQDKELFFCDLKKLNWSEFFINYCKGIRLYIIKDPDDTIPEARVRFTRLYFVHQITKVILIISFCRLIWFVSNVLYRFFL